MRDFIQIFLLCVEAFFILYMILYSSFLFLSVTVGFLRPLRRQAAQPAEE